MEGLMKKTAEKLKIVPGKPKDQRAQEPSVPAPAEIPPEDPSAYHSCER